MRENSFIGCLPIPIARSMFTAGFHVSTTVVKAETAAYPAVAIPQMPQMSQMPQIPQMPQMILPLVAPVAPVAPLAPGPLGPMVSQQFPMNMGMLPILMSWLNLKTARCGF